MNKLFKKFVALAIAATMVMGMAVTAFAEDEGSTTTLADGTYTVSTTLYKDAACTSTSMGNKGMVDSTLVISDNGTKATFTFKTRKFTYLGMNGWLNTMALDGVSGVPNEKETIDGVEYHNFVFSGTLPVSSFVEGNVFYGEFHMYIITELSGRDGTGYLKINSITPAAAN